MEFKSVIVHLPIDLTDICNYKNNARNKNESFNVSSVDINKPVGSLYKDCWDNTNKKKDVNIFSGSKQYEKISTLIIPKYYNNSNDSHIYCWHCSCKIEDNVCGIPEKYEKGTFYMKGMFCSFNCALTFNYDYSQVNDNVIQEREALIRMIYRNITGKSDSELHYAPPREALKMFGGYMTHEEFHRNRNIVNVIYQPLEPIDYFIEENILIEDENKSGKSNDLVNFVK